MKRSERKKYDTHDHLISESRAIWGFVSINQNQTATYERK